MVNRYSKNQNILPSIFPARGPTASDRIKAAATEVIDRGDDDAHCLTLSCRFVIPTA